HNAVDLEQPLGLRVPVGLLDVEGVPAAVLTGAGFQLFEDLAEGGLDVGRPFTQQCRDPHPDHCIGSAAAYGAGDAGYIAVSDTAGQRDREGLEGRDSLIGALAPEHLPEDGWDLADLNRAGADREIDTRAETQVDEGGGPHNSVEPVDESGHASPFVVAEPGSPPRCGKVCATALTVASTARFSRVPRESPVMHLISEAHCDV